MGRQRVKGGDISPLLQLSGRNVSSYDFSNFVCPRIECHNGTLKLLIYKRYMNLRHGPYIIRETFTKFLYFITK